MRLASGVADQFIYFVAVDATDLKTRETGLTTFTVRRSRNGGASAAYTTPTINETDVTNMPGVYELLVDEDVTIDAGDETQAYVLHITHAGMAPVTREIELYRPKITVGNTLDVTATGEAGLDYANTAGTIDAADLATGVITAAKFAAGAIDAAAIANGAIDAATFAAGAIDAAAIATGAIDADALATDAVNEIRDAIMPKINTAFSNIEFLMVDSTDHVTAETGLIVTVNRSIDGGAFGAGTGTVEEVSNGIYQYDASAADMNGKVITFRFSATGADDTFLTVVTGGT